MDTKNIVKTGTTILGIVCKDGVVMAGDNRATIGGSLIAIKDMKKVFPLNDYLVFSGCGSATEAQKVSKLLTAEMKLKHLRSKSRPTVQQAAGLLSNIQVSESAFILAGIDQDGTASIYDILGQMANKVSEYTASIGSGMPYSLGFLERAWKPNLTVKEGIELAVESIKASSARDVGSGNGIDVYTLTKEGIKKVVSQKVEEIYKNKE
ncbi:proteasome subunit beta [archaeon]|nr:proteasome subunit beta [archaeon]PJC45467.1 MAG: proteasome subunit beta [Candidatus Pacearchaeota archaeon CG_4_9_14_0_2_um_filter_30_8]